MIKGYRIGSSIIDGPKLMKFWLSSAEINGMDLLASLFTIWRYSYQDSTLFVLSFILLMCKSGCDKSKWISLRWIIPLNRLSWLRYYRKGRKVVSVYSLYYLLNIFNSSYSYNRFRHYIRYFQYFKSLNQRNLV